VCVVCGAPANHSQRIVPGEDRVLVGATEAYEPRCRQCFEPRPVQVEHPRPHADVVDWAPEEADGEEAAPEEEAAREEVASPEEAR
jgi:thymidine kinase